MYILGGYARLHGILAGMSNSANMTADFTDWLELAHDPPPVYPQILGGTDLGTPWLPEKNGHIRAI